MNLNPVMQAVQQAVQVMNIGQNPMSLLQQSLGNNPKAVQAMQMMQGKDARFLQTMAMNMARERGIDVNALIQNLGIRI